MNNKEREISTYDYFIALLISVITGFGAMFLLVLLGIGVFISIFIGMMYSGAMSIFISKMLEGGNQKNEQKQDKKICE